MFEETLVCLHCSRPVDSKVYCSDECENLDSTSPSASASSSTLSSPFLHSAMNGPSNLADIPPLVPSMIGNSAAYRGHRGHNSISSSSNSSFGWSALSDDEGDAAYPNVSIEGEHSYNLDPYAENSLKSSLHPHSALLYTRRPSSTNHSSIVPILSKRSSAASPSIAPVRTPFGTPSFSLSAEDDMSDIPSASLSSSSSSVRSRRKAARPLSVGLTSLVVPNPHDLDMAPANQRTRNRKSLPAYFSLLQMSPSKSPPSGHSTVSSSSRGFSSLSQSLRTPMAPQVAHPLLDLTPAHAQPLRPIGGIEATPRGRLHQRDPRSASGRRSSSRSPPRRMSRPQASSPSPYRHRHVAIGTHTRSRVDKVEKTFEQVPIIPVRGRTAARRNSSPLARCDTARDELFNAISDMYGRRRETMGHDECASSPRKDDMRGRRMPSELNGALQNANAPGYGSGRSGLRGRERQHSRATVFR